MLRKYNPKRINASWNAIPFLGYMDGTFLEIEYDEDAVTPHVGSTGDVSLILNPNKMAKLTATFIQGSPTNDALSVKIPDARRNFMPTGPISVKDLNGTTLIGGKDSVIGTVAKVEFGKTITGRKWMWIVPEAEIFVGGGGD